MLLPIAIEVKTIGPISIDILSIHNFPQHLELAILLTQLIINSCQIGKLYLKLNKRANACLLRKIVDFSLNCISIEQDHNSLMFGSI